MFYAQEIGSAGFCLRRETRDQKTIGDIWKVTSICMVVGTMEEDYV
jgi:hypothetical protein